MNNKNRTANPPRGLSGPIYRGWSDEFFGRAKSTTMPSPLALVLPVTSDLPPSDKSAPINPATPFADLDQAVCPAIPEGQVADTINFEDKPDEIASVKPKAFTGKAKRHCGTPEDLIGLVPLEGTIPKNRLIAEWRVRFGNHQRGRALLKKLIADGKLFEWRTNRTGTNPAKSISRHPQPANLK